MKKLSVLILIMSFALFLNAEWYSFGLNKEKGVEGLSLITSNDARTEIHLSLSGMEVKNAERGFQEIDLVGAQHKIVEGAPKIPYYRKTIAIPDRGNPVIKVENVKTITLKDRFKIVPAQPPLPEVRDYTPKWTYDEKIYNTDEFLPKDIAGIKKIETIRSFRVAHIEIYPFQYNPKTGEVRVITDCDIVITYEGQGEKEITRQIPITPRWESIYKQMIWNYDEVKDTKPYYDNIHARVTNINDTKGGTKASPENNKPYFTEGDYLIFIPGNSGDIYPGTGDWADKDILEEFAAWKLKLGYMPEVHWVDPNITPHELQQIISGIYYDDDDEHNDPNITPEFVLIIGEGEEQEKGWHIEAHPWHESNYNYGVESGIVRNDHYYSLVPDSIDWHSDLFVARISADGPESITIDSTYPEFQLWVEKIMRYEGNPPEGDWYTSAFAIGDTEDGRIFNRTARLFMRELNDSFGYEIDTMLENNYGDGEMAEPLRDSIGDGHNILVFRGHGDEGAGFGWYGGKNNNYDLWIDSALVTQYLGVESSKGVGVVFAPTCLANNFTYPDTDATGEVMINMALDRGITAYFGATNVSLSYYNDSMALGICHALTGAVPTREFQVVAVYGKNYMETYSDGDENYFRLENYLMNDLSDPALRIWKGVPDTFVVSHELQYDVGKEDTIVITVFDNSKAPLKGATVVLWDTTGNDNVYMKDATDDNGQVTFVTTFQDTGTNELMITVSKTDYLPYTGTASIVEPTSAMSSVSLMARENNGVVELNWNVIGKIGDNLDIYRNNQFLTSVETEKGSYTDENPLNGDNIYTLKINGKEIATTRINVKTYPFKLYGIAPYMIKNNATLSFSMPRNDNITVEIYDISGKRVYSKIFKASKGINKINLNAEEINAGNGTYFIKLSYGDKEETSKFLIAR